jgi:hypothetical protein
MKHGWGFQRLELMPSSAHTHAAGAQAERFFDGRQIPSEPGPNRACAYSDEVPSRSQASVSSEPLDGFRADLQNLCKFSSRQAKTRLDLHGYRVPAKASDPPRGAASGVSLAVCGDETRAACVPLRALALLQLNPTEPLTRRQRPRSDGGSAATSFTPDLPTASTARPDPLQHSTSLGLPPALQAGCRWFETGIGHHTGCGRHPGDVQEEAG